MKSASSGRLVVGRELSLYENTMQCVLGDTDLEILLLDV